MKRFLPLLLATVLFACTKPKLETTAPVTSPTPVANKVDTVKFNVYAIKFDSVSTNAYNLCIIKVYNGKMKDSVTASMGMNYGLACRNASLDTVSNKILVTDEDSTAVKFTVQNNDTVEFFVVSTLCKLAPIHAANFRYTGTFTKVYEVPSIQPGPQNGPMAGVHICKNVNTVFIP